jgi:hypothetical protein
MKTPAVIVCVVSALLVAQSAAAAVCQLDVPNDNGYLRYDVLAPAMPPTRTVLSFDARGGRHVEVVWDPLQSNRLDRMIILEGNLSWTLSVSAEPLRDPNQGKYDYAWQFAPNRCGSLSDGALTMPVKRLVPDCLQKGGSCDTLTVDMLDFTIKKVGKNLSASEVARNLVRREGGKPSDAAVSTGGRSLVGPDSAQIVNDIASLIAEVAIERARDRSLKLAERRVGDFLHCPPNEGSHEGSHFQQTCKLLTKFRMTDLASSGQALAQAVSEDLLTSVMEKELTNASAEASLCPGLQWSALMPIVRSALAPDSQREPDEVLAHRLIGMMAQSCAAPSPQDTSCNPVQLSLAVLSECAQGLDCDTSSIQFYLSHANELFQECSPQGVPKKIFDSVSFVAKGLEVVVPKADVSPRRQLRVAVSMLTDVLKYQAWASSQDGQRFSKLISRLDSLQPQQEQSLQALASVYEAPLLELIAQTQVLDQKQAASAYQAFLIDPRFTKEKLDSVSKISQGVQDLIKKGLTETGGAAIFKELCNPPPPSLDRLCKRAKDLESLPLETKKAILDKQWPLALNSFPGNPQGDLIPVLREEWKKAEELANLVKKLEAQQGSKSWQSFYQLQTAIKTLTETAKSADAATVEALQPVLRSQDRLMTLCREVSGTEKASMLQDPVKKTLASIHEACESLDAVRREKLAEWPALRGQIEAGNCSIPGWDEKLKRLADAGGVPLEDTTLPEKLRLSLCDERHAPLDAVARFMDSLLANDFQSAILNLLTAIPKKLDDQQVKVLSTLTSFLRTYGQTQALKPEDAAQLREARKQSISTLIDLLTSREHRAGHWIASLAVNPGLASAYQLPRGKSGEGRRGTVLMRLNLPLGLSLDCFDSLRKNFGFHGSIFVLDLGQYAEAAFRQDQGLPKPGFGTALTFGTQVGLLLNSAEDPINLSFDFRYSPVTGVRIGQSDNDAKVAASGRVSMGLTVSYLIPLIDFN